MSFWPVILAVSALGMLLPALPKLRGTTLIAPWAWAIVSIAVLAAVEVWIANDSTGATAVEPRRYIAALSTLCPLVALLGAKRPQDKAWQAIVISLWGILALPAGESWLMRPNESLSVHPLWQWFVAVVIVVGAVNWLGTRHWISGLLLFYAQWSLLSRWLPLAAPLDVGPAGTLGLIAVAIAIAWPSYFGARHVPKSLDRLWFDFRDHFGLVWALRLAERINSTAAMNNWDVHLGRAGFHSRTSPPAWQQMPAELEASVRTTLGGMLRRFVSDDWIAKRLS